MKQALTVQLPFINVRAIPATIEAALDQELIALNDFDLVVSALGNPTSELALNERMRHVLAQRVGLDGAVPQTLEEVGAGLGITRERVRQLESRALRELRTVAPGLEFYLRT